MVANEWKDANDKVMPVKQWLEERRFLQVLIYLPLFYVKVLFMLNSQSSGISLMLTIVCRSLSLKG